MATREEYAAAHYSKNKYPANTSVCNKVKISIEDQGNAKYWDHLRAKVVIRDMKNNELNRFLIYRKFHQPIKIAGALDHTYPPSDLTIPFGSGVHSLIALNDCTFLAVIEEGVIRFTADGVTKAKLPPNAILVYGNELQTLESNFLASPPQGDVKNDQDRFHFYHLKLFKGEQQ